MSRDEEIINIEDMKLEDVLIENGEKKNYRHLVGMIAFKAMVESRLESYIFAASQNEKTYLTYTALQSVTASGGRFVVRNKKNKGEKNSRELRILGEKDARRKTRDCFRDCIKNVRKGATKRASALLSTIGLPRTMFHKSDSYAEILHRVATNPRLILFLHFREGGGGGSAVSEVSRNMAITPAASCVQAASTDPSVRPCSPPEAISEADNTGDVSPALPPLETFSSERDVYTKILPRVATTSVTRESTEASRSNTTPAVVCSAEAVRPFVPFSSSKAEAVDLPADVVVSSSNMMVTDHDSGVIRSSRGRVVSVSIYCKGVE